MLRKTRTITRTIRAVAIAVLTATPLLSEAVAATPWAMAEEDGSGGTRPVATEIAPYGKLGELPLTAVTPDGWTREFLDRQRAGLTGHPHVSGYPFNTPMWSGTVYRPVGHWGDDWWPYEQTGYYIDGAVRCAHLLKDQALLKNDTCEFRVHLQACEGATANWVATVL